MPAKQTQLDRPAQRADAVRNYNRLLNSAAVTFLGEGPRVSMQRIAQDAGVGIGTLYRHFPDRTALLAALSSRAYRAVLDLALTCQRTERDPVQALLNFLLGTISHRDVLVLPLHGAPAVASEADLQTRHAISAVLDELLRDGQARDRIRTDVNSTDIIVAGALLAQSLSNLPEHEALARRCAQIFIDGLRPTRTRLTGEQVTRQHLEDAWKERS
nr:TetR/AcrR family transcriptional regulator [Deinococcus marmoris]